MLDRTIPSTAKVKRKRYPLLRRLTILFALAGAVLMVLLAGQKTIHQAGSRSDLFWMYLALEGLFQGAAYLSLFTLLLVLTQRVRERENGAFQIDPFVKGMRYLLVGVSLTSIATSVLVPLTLKGLLHGSAIMVYAAIGGLLVQLYVVLGVYTLITRIHAKRLTEYRRLAEEKMAWDTYLN